MEQTDLYDPRDVALLRAGLDRHGNRVGPRVDVDTAPQRGVDLDAARARVGQATGVDPLLWYWKPVDVRWIAGQWDLTKTGDSDAAFLRALRIIYPDPPRPWWSHVAEWLTAAGNEIAKGATWALFRSPPPLRVFAWLSGLFLYAFVTGVFE